MRIGETTAHASTPAHTPMRASLNKPLQLRLVARAPMRREQCPAISLIRDQVPVPTNLLPHESLRSFACTIPWVSDQ